MLATELTVSSQADAWLLALCRDTAGCARGRSRPAPIRTARSLPGVRLQRAAGALVEPAVGPLGEPYQQRVGGGCGRVDVELQDPVVAGEHDQLAAAPALPEPVELAAGDLRDPVGPDAAPAKGVPELGPHRARVGPGRELEQRGDHRAGRPRP